MTGLAEFLLARIAEDEAEAFGNRPDGYVMRDVNGSTATTVGGRRLRAECEAKRRIIEWHKAWPVLVDQPPTMEQDDAERRDYAVGDVSSLVVRVSQRIAWMTEQSYRECFGSEAPTGPMLRLLALPYADHPDYQQEWTT